MEIRTITKGKDVSSVIGEIIETSSCKIVCESLKLNHPPAFGSFIAIDSHAEIQGLDDPFESSSIASGIVFAVVYHASTASSETGRRATAYGLESEELHRQQPQISELLTTDFRALIIGYSDHSQIFHCLPKIPPQLHARVRMPLQNELQLLTVSRNFIESLLQFAECEDPDELVAASIRCAALIQLSPQEYLVEAARELVTLLRDDYDRLRRILRKLEVSTQ